MLCRYMNWREAKNAFRIQGMGHELEEARPHSNVGSPGRQTPGYRGTLDRRPRHSNLNVQHTEQKSPPPPPPSCSVALLRHGPGFKVTPRAYIIWLSHPRI